MQMCAMASSWQDSTHSDTVGKEISSSKWEKPSNDQSRIHGREFCQPARRPMNFFPVTEIV